jgi:hypothetical protein
MNRRARQLGGRSDRGAATVPQRARFRCRPQTPGALIQRCGQASRLAAKPLDNRCILHPIIIAEDSELSKLFMRWH